MNVVVKARHMDVTDAMRQYVESKAGKLPRFYDGILSIDPAGQVLPCSSFQDGIGSLLDKSFLKIFSSRQAAYWRKKKFIPPVCGDCPDSDVCGGGCPLYWDAAGSFEEIPMHNSADCRSRKKWENKRKHSKSFGVPAPGSVEN